MRIAFYAPLKAPDHPVPSGDRQMARLLVRALGLAGHTVEVASRLRSFMREPSDAGHVSVSAAASAEIARLAGEWTAASPPDLWFCYHPYYKAPDLIGPNLCARFGIPYVTAEASYSSRRNIGAWAAAQDEVVRAVRQAALNICLTRRDLDGLSPLVQAERLVHLPPFIDTTPFVGAASGTVPSTLLTVAMMRPGDKMDSFRMLAEALRLCADVAWRLVVVGDGPCRDEVHAAFAALGPDRVTWLGERRPDEIPHILAGGDLLAWPGFGEAYGLAYLEAQAAGLPVVAQDIAGVPEVVRHGTTGILTPQGDVPAYAAAIALLLDDPVRRRAMAGSARRFVLEERSLDIASARLGALLEGISHDR
jgi:glycosyltransferase involved in cell wall biosynthesis